jgi:hypothetical protein
MIITRDDASPKKSQTGVKRTHYKRAQVGAGTRTIPRTSKVMKTTLDITESKKKI